MYAYFASCLFLVVLCIQLSDKQVFALNSGLFIDLILLIFFYSINQLN